MERGEGKDIDSGALDSGAAQYLARCQVDTPIPLVELVWRLVSERRSSAGHVVDFGCGDARFARGGAFETYTGYEIDPQRRPKSLPVNSRVKLQNAFTARGTSSTFDTCIGNPPYVRHHSLLTDWVQAANCRLSRVEGYSPDGRSNAYVYFMWLALDAVDDAGLVALVVPYEWVSRPASEKLREYIRSKRWSVDVYFLEDAAFERVLTTACITVIDKSSQDGEWRLHQIFSAGTVKRHRQLTLTQHRRLKYERAESGNHAKRGLSPGDQDHFVLTEAQRIRFRLKAGTDVVPAVTSFKDFKSTQLGLTERLFRSEFVDSGRRCWLVNTAQPPGAALTAYLDGVPAEVRGNYTCSNREVWWKFSMPALADILYASGFKGDRPKMVINEVGAVHVGSIHGIYCTPRSRRRDLLGALMQFDFGRKVVPLAKGFLKVEVNQMNAVINELLVE